MRLQEPLTKENFWNDMMQKYPNAMKIFCAWIDEYKEAVNWKRFFATDIKFHDLPHAMQLGIWLEYINQRGGCQFEIENFFEFDLRNEIENMMKELLEPEAVFELED